MRICGPLLQAALGYPGRPSCFLLGRSRRTRYAASDMTQRGAPDNRRQPFGVGPVAARSKCSWFSWWRCLSLFVAFPLAPRSPGAFWGWRPSVPDSQRLPIVCVSNRECADVFPPLSIAGLAPTVLAFGTQPDRCALIHFGPATYAASWESAVLLGFVSK